MALIYPTMCARPAVISLDSKKKKERDQSCKNKAYLSGNGASEFSILSLQPGKPVLISATSPSGRDLKAPLPAAVIRTLCIKPNDI